MRKYAIILAVLTCLLLVPKASAWSNGGYSADPSHPDYGTHDWIAQHALDWLPAGEKSYINLSAYLLGTELPDNPNSSIGGIGDTMHHHVYYRKNGTLQANDSAMRAQEEYAKALTCLKAGDYRNASIRAGVMSHYIVDVAVWCHVMGAYTDWGAESNHSNYENYVTGKMKNSTSLFDPYLTYDGSLDTVSAYSATLSIAYNSTFGDGNLKNCTWMNTHYNWSDPEFKDSCGASLNLAVNMLADVLYTLYNEWGGAVEERFVIVLGALIVAAIIAIITKKRMTVTWRTYQ
jgi:hypothetical protein